MLQIFDASDVDGWLGCLSRFQGHDTYHLPLYQQLCKPDEGRAFLVHISNAGGEAALPLIMRPISKAAPAGTYGDGAVDVTSAYGHPGLLVTMDESQASAEAFARAITAELVRFLAESGAVTAFLRQNPFFDTSWVFRRAGIDVKSSPVVAMNLTLSGSERRAAAHRQHRRNIRRCDELGVIATSTHDPSNMADFLACYQEMILRNRARLSHHYSINRLRVLVKELSAQVQLWVASLDGELLAGAVNLRTNGLIHGYLGCASDRGRGLGVFDWLIDEMSEDGHRRGDRWLSLGGGVGGKPDGVQRFKLQRSPYRFSYDTVRIVLDETRYAELCRQRTPTDDFFPAYRSASRDAETILPPVSGS